MRGVSPTPNAAIPQEWSVPAVSTDRDSHVYHPSTWDWPGSTPDLFASMCENAILRGRKAGAPPILTVYNVSEHAEGGAGLQPNMRDGKGYLDALRRALNSTATAELPPPDKTVTAASDKFTPVVADAASGGGEGVPAYAYGEYTRRGNAVTLSITMTNIVTTAMTAGNDVIIRGLPFPAWNVPTGLGGLRKWTGAVRLNMVGFSGYVVAEISEGQDYIKLMDCQNGAVGTYIKVSDLTSGQADIYLSIEYQVEA